MKSSAQLPVKYAKYWSTMTLAEYESDLGKPNGTHTSRKCGEAMGSFLACYLEDKIINNEPDAQTLETEYANIDRLIKEKQCQIIFDEQKQLGNIFEKLSENLPLYRVFVERKYLTTVLQCSNGNTFFYYYLTKLSLTNKDALNEAMGLIEADKSLLSLRGEAGCPITLLVSKVISAVKTDKTNIAYPELTKLLKLCQVDGAKDILQNEEKSSLLQNCFALLEQAQDKAVARLGFEAAIAAANLGMPLHQPMKGCADSQTALFAYVMELDTTLEWGAESFKRLLRVANPEVVNLQIKVNPEAVTCELARNKQPDDVQSYIYIDKPDVALDRSRIVQSQASGNYHRMALSLEVASEFYTVSSVLAQWIHAGNYNAREHLTSLFVDQSSGSQTKFRSDNPDSFIFNLPVKHLTEKVLPKTSKYRGSRDGRSYVLRGVHEYDQYTKKQERKYFLATYLSPYTTTCEYDSVPPELSHLTRDHNGQGLFIDRIRLAGNDTKNHRVIRNYYFAYVMIPDQVIKKNALLVYLEKGGSGEEAASLDRYRTQRSFNFVSSTDPRLVRFAPGQIQLTSIYQSESYASTGECLLKPSGTKEKTITQFRSYDLGVIKEFKRLGFDFSAPEVTAWMSGFISREKPSPALFELLACLKWCGAIFPDKINDVSYPDFICKRLAECTEQEVVAWLTGDDFKLSDVELINAHKATFEFGPEDELKPMVYLSKFVQKFRLLHEANANYPELLEQWLQGLRKAEINLSGEVYHKIYGNYKGAMACLNAYLASGNYDNEELQYGSSYFSFFFSLIKMRLRLFSEQIDLAMAHKSAKQPKLWGKMSTLKRALTTGSEVELIKANINEIINITPRDLNDRVNAIERYLQVNEAVKDALKNGSVKKSKSVTTCFTRYIREMMFEGEFDLTSVSDNESLMDLSNTLDDEARSRLLSIMDTDASRVMRATVSPIAPPLEYTPPSVKGKDDAISQDVVPEPSAPPADAEEPIQALYPSTHELPYQAHDTFDQRCLAYKAMLDGLYQAKSVDALLGDLNEKINLINENLTILPSPLPMVICRDTHQFAKYPCMIDQNTMVYYDLDNVMQAIKNGHSMEGIEGDLTISRITFRPVSEVVMMLYILEMAKAQLDLVPVAEVRSAYGMSK